MALCSTRILYDRHVRPKEFTAGHLSSHVTGPDFYRLQLLHTRRHRTAGLCRNGHLHLRGRVLTRRRARAVHVLRRGIPASHPRHRHEQRYGRDLGFNSIISFSSPKMVESFTPTGAFMRYACWNIFGFIVAYFFLPESKNLTLEELDSVFAVRNRDHAQFYVKKAPWYANKYVLRRDVAPFPALYEVDDHRNEHRKHEKGEQQQGGCCLVSGDLNGKQS